MTFTSHVISVGYFSCVTADGLDNMFTADILHSLVSWPLRGIVIRKDSSAAAVGSLLKHRHSERLMLRFTSPLRGLGTQLVPFSRRELQFVELCRLRIMNSRATIVVEWRVM